MGICENVQFLCKKNKSNLPISHLEKELSLANGSIRRWNENSPSADKVQRVAKYFGVTTDFLLTGYDKELIEAITDLSKTVNGKHYFPDIVIDALGIELEDIRREYWDVPLDLDPLEMIGLIKDTPQLSTFFKKDLLDALKRVKQNIDRDNSEIQTLAANHDGDEWTDEELAEIEKFKEFIRSKRNDKS